MDLRGYVFLFRRYAAVLVVVPLIVGLLSLLNADRQPRLFASTATLLLRPNDPNERLGTSDQVGTETFVNTDRYVRAQADIARGPDIRGAAASFLGTVSAEDIREALTVIPATDANILRIRATSKSPETSQAIANAVADAFIENRRRSAVKGLERAIDDIAERGEELAAEVQRLEAEDPDSDDLSTLQQQYRTLSDRQLDLRIDLNLKKGEAEVIAAAEAAKQPLSPKPLRSGILGLLSGLALAAMGVVVWDRLDVRLRSRQEAETLTHLPTLAEIPTDRRFARGQTDLADLAELNSPVAEATRALRVSLQFLAAEAPLQVILVTSPTPGDGKSTISSNLAALFAQAGERTLLVSADLRRPTVSRLTGLDAQEPGLVDLLAELAEGRDLRSKRPSRALVEQAELAAAPTSAAANKVASTVDIAAMCHEISEGLWVLAPGRAVANPLEVLSSSVTKDFFALAREQFDVIVVDTPPVMPVSDAVVLSPMVDGVLVVAAVRTTSRVHLARTVEILRAGQARLLGLAVNRVGVGGDGYYHGYSAAHERSRP